MNTLPFPSFNQFKYGLLQYPKINNLLRNTEFNRKALEEKVQRSTYQLEDQHVLVGLLKQLTINPEWELDYVVEHARLRAPRLASLFKMTTINNMGSPVKNFFFSGDCCEHLTLIDNNTKYLESMLNIEDLKPVIPLYTTTTVHSYKPSIERSPSDGGTPKEFAIWGIDVVELAVGWWLYMKQNRTVDTGIHAYLVKYPLVNAQLTQNQLAVINVLYEHIVNERPYSELIKTEYVNFTTVDLSRHLEEYYSFLVKRYKGKRLTDIGNLLAQVYSIYDGNFFNYVEAGKFGLFSQTRWIWEPAILKLYTIYLTLGNDLFYKCGDINTNVSLSHRTRNNNYQQITDRHLRDHILMLSNKVNELNIENTK